MVNEGTTELNLPFDAPHVCPSDRPYSCVHGVHIGIQRCAQHRREVTQPRIRPPGTAIMLRGASRLIVRQVGHAVHPVVPADCTALANNAISNQLVHCSPVAGRMIATTHYSCVPQARQTGLAQQQRCFAEAAVAPKVDWDSLENTIASDDGKRDLASLRSTFIDVEQKFDTMSKVYTFASWNSLC